jgi:hypothetical protein
MGGKPADANESSLLKGRRGYAIRRPLAYLDFGAIVSAAILYGEIKVLRINNALKGHNLKAQGWERVMPPTLGK